MEDQNQITYHLELKRLFNEDNRKSRKAYGKYFKYFENILVYLPNYRHDRKIFIVADHVYLRLATFREILLSSSGKA